MSSTPDRRAVLRGLGAAALVGCASGSEPRQRSTDDLDRCVPAPPQVAGPYQRGAPMRRDIREGKPGAALEMQLRLLDATTCAPLAGAIVSVWHADALGVYSGFRDQGAGRDGDEASTFLRGTARAGADGVATFDTIVPGWYPGRVTHIHAAVTVGDRELLTTQLYFPDAIMRRVYATGAYAKNGWRDTEDDTDDVRRRQPSGDELRLTLREREGGFVTRHDIAVKGA